MKTPKVRKPRKRHSVNLDNTLVSPVLDLVVGSPDAGSRCVEPEGLPCGVAPAARSPVSFIEVRPADQPLDRRKPYIHQLQAWNRLDAHLTESEAADIFAGLLVMPTGSGKTFTAVHWLTRRVIERGGRVLWLAHRHELLEQATTAFRDLAYLAPSREVVRIRVVSGDHCHADEIESTDDVIIGSVPGLYPHAENLRPLLDDPRTLVVVDEAHHATAKIYRALIRPANGAPRLLGLTATPTRTEEGERPQLSRLFGGRIIYQVSPVELTERGILAQPVPERVQTSSHVEAGLIPDEEGYVARHGELPDSMMDRIARLETRNAVIVDRYLENRGRYGKTVIFAINVDHAVLLADRLHAAGVSVEYVAHRRDDAQDNRDIIARFRDPAGGLDIVINVMILTEGVNLPEVQTVFLARPTRSEILMRQMVGRALRGPEAGGTKRAYLVSFEDHWSRFRDWRSPLELVPDLVAPEVPPEEQLQPRPQGEAVPWDVLKAVSQLVRRLAPVPTAESFEAVPEGFFVVAPDGPDEPARLVPILAHQRPHWTSLIDHLMRLSAEGLSTLAGPAQVDGFFSGCMDPRPALHDVGLVLEHVRRGGGRPEYRVLSERAECDPRRLAELIRDGDLGERARTELIAARYTPLARAVYPTPRDFRAAVDDALFSLQQADSTSTSMLAVAALAP